jgi:heme A synthase
MTAAVFIPLVVVLVFAFGFFIRFLSRKLSGRISQRAFLTGVLVIIAGILGGIVLMFQPWTVSVFNLGFDLVLISTLAFTAWSHVTPKPRMVQAAER